MSGSINIAGFTDESLYLIDMECECIDDVFGPYQDNNILRGRTDSYIDSCLSYEEL